MIKAIKTFFTYITGILTGIGFGALGIAIFAILMQESDRRLGRRPSYSSPRPYAYTPPKYTSYSKSASEHSEVDKKSLIHILNENNEFESLEEAEGFIKDFKDMANQYGYLALQDVFEELGVSTSINTSDYGWLDRDIYELQAHFAEGYYFIDFPEFYEI